MTYDKKKEMQPEEIRITFCPRCSAQSEFCGCIEEHQRPPSILDAFENAGRMNEAGQLLRQVHDPVFTRPKNLGYFVGQPETVWLEDGESMMLLRDYSYIDPKLTEWMAKRGARIDGASIPRVFWSYADPYRGKYRNASVVHDYYCVTRERADASTHFMFYQAMMASGVAPLKAKFFYYAVKHFGPKWGYYNNDVKQGGQKAPRTRVKDAVKPELVGRIADYIAKRDPSIKEIDAQAPWAPGRIRLD
jgi:hypothetical protein